MEPGSGHKQVENMPASRCVISGSTEDSRRFSSVAPSLRLDIVQNNGQVWSCAAKPPLIKLEGNGPYERISFANSRNSDGFRSGRTGSGGRACPCGDDHRRMGKREGAAGA